MTCCERGWSKDGDRGASRVIRRSPRFRPPFPATTHTTTLTAPMYSHISDYPPDLLERATRVRLVGFDVDGTLTDGRRLFDNDGRELKAFHVRDGLGLALLRRYGFEV